MNVVKSRPQTIQSHERLRSKSFPELGLWHKQQDTIEQQPHHKRVGDPLAKQPPYDVGDVRKQNNDTRKLFLLGIICTPTTGREELVEHLTEIQLYQHLCTDIENCKAVAAILGVLLAQQDERESVTLRRHSKPLVQAAALALEGFLTNQCLDVNNKKEEQSSSFIYFGVSHEKLAHMLSCLLDTNMLDGRPSRSVIACLCCLVKRGDAVQYVDSRSVLACLAMRREQPDVYTLLEAAKLLKLLIMHGYNTEEMIQEGAVHILCRVFCTTERRKTLVLLETLLLVIVSHPLGRQNFLRVQRLSSILARLLSLASTSKGQPISKVLLRTSLGLIAVAIEKRQDLKQLLLSSKHLPSIIRLLGDDASDQHLADDIVRVIAYVVHQNELQLEPLLPCIPPLLQVISLYKTSHTSKVASSVLIELCAYSYEARLMLVECTDDLDGGIQSALPDANQVRTLLLVFKKARHPIDFEELPPPIE